MGFIYENILNWAQKEVAGVSCDPKEQLDWLYLVQDAFEQVRDELEMAIGFVRVESLPVNSVLQEEEFVVRRELQPEDARTDLELEVDLEDWERFQNEQTKSVREWPES